MDYQNLNDDHDNYRSDQSESKKLDYKNSKNNANLINSTNIPRNSAHEYERKIQELCERIEALESNLSKSNQQRSRLSEKLKEVSEENEKYQEQIARLANKNQKQNEEIYQLSNKINEVETSGKTVNDKFKNKFEILAKEIEEKEDQIEKIYNQLKAKDETVKFFSVTHDQNIRNQEIIKNENENLRKEKIELNNKISDLKMMLDDAIINKKSESGLLIEIEHLKDDNKRLLNLLRSTEEYKDFAYLAEETSGGVKYVKGGKLNLSKKDTTKDPENWVPLDAYNFIHEFKSQYRIEMSEELISDLLSSLNKIWREREKKIIAKAKTKCEIEVSNIRRQNSMKTGMGESTAMKTITKLKKDLKQAREEGKKYMVEKSRLNDIPSGITLIDNALKLATTYQSAQKKLDYEMKNLKSKSGDKLNKENNENQGRLKFNEGALWMINRCLEELISLQNKIQDITNEYSIRAKPGNNEGQSNIRNFNNAGKWLIQTLDYLLIEYVNKFKDWSFNSNKNIDSIKALI